MGASDEVEATGRASGRAASRAAVPSVPSQVPVAVSAAYAAMLSDWELLLQFVRDFDSSAEAPVTSSVA